MFCMAGWPLGAELGEPTLTGLLSNALRARRVAQKDLSLTADAEWTCC